ncbi:HEAT repeat domain-containing protein [Asticcacaulis solisilvae]|uniref:HEAT repeat domain-containing protein n=1 Tax=Asticcacaulis solisilvae TaxID=1217274 RepID=UPI003FD6F37A
MTPDIDAQCIRIVRKLKAAAAADRTFAVFGAESHRYAIGPKVSEAQIRAFETEHGIDLPAHYRAFLTQVGNGTPDRNGRSAAGPFYGIYPFGAKIDAFVYKQNGHLRAQPFVNPDMPQSEWDEAAKPLDADDISDDDYAEGNRRLFGGLLPIGHQGCQSYHALVLQGPNAGRVVNVDVDRYLPQFCFEANFLDWYERWLDEIISGIATKDGPNWFGYSMGGDDEHLLTVFNSTDKRSEKSAALDGFGKLTSISAKSVDEMVRIAASDDPDFRRKAFLILAEFAYPQAHRFLHDHLEGDEGQQLTACQAIHWYAKDHAAEWVDRVGPIAESTSNVELFRFASYVLEASGRDCSRYLVPAASHPNEDIRGAALYAIGKSVQAPDAIDALLRGLSDESPKVVHAALQAHKKALDDRFIAAYASIARRFKIDEHYIHANLGHHLKAIGYDSIPAFVADFEAGKVPRRSFWSRLLGRKS